MKRCWDCGEVKPLSAFSRCVHRYDGLQAACKSCKSKRYRAWKAKRRAHCTSLEGARRSALKRPVGWARAPEIARYYSTAAELRRWGVGVAVDHAVPVRGRTVCGLHVQCNLRLSFSCQNMRKGARHWPDRLGDLPGQFRTLCLHDS